MLNTIKVQPKLFLDEEVLCKNANTYLGYRGYCIFKNSIDEKSKMFIRNKLIFIG